MYQKPIFKLFMALSLLFLSNCSHTDFLEVQKQKNIQEDEPYFASLTKETRRIELYDDLATKLHAHITYLSTDFKQVFNARLKNLFEHSVHEFLDDKKVVGFIVSIYSPKDSLMNLEDRDLWAIYLANQEEKINPKMIRQLSKKERWKSFFPYIHKWSQEYLLLFDIPHEKIRTQNLVIKAEDSMALYLKNSTHELKGRW